MPTTVTNGLARLFLFASLLASAETAFSANATIVRASVTLHESFPTYRASTLLKFRLVPGRTLTTIPKKARVEVTSKRIVARTQEWFQLTYETSTKTYRGWVYAGEVDDRKYVRLDPGVEKRLSDSAARLPELGAPGPDFLPALHAQAADVASPPPAETKTLPTLLLALAHVAIFIGSLFSTKKWIFPNSNFFSFLTSLGILLILGFLPAVTFANLIADLLT